MSVEAAAAAAPPPVPMRVAATTDPVALGSAITIVLRRGAAAELSCAGPAAAWVLLRALANAASWLEREGVVLRCSAARWSEADQGLQSIGVTASAA